MFTAQLALLSLLIQHCVGRARLGGFFGHGIVFVNETCLLMTSSFFTVYVKCLEPMRCFVPANYGHIHRTLFRQFYCFILLLFLHSPSRSNTYSALVSSAIRTLIKMYFTYEKSFQSSTKELPVPFTLCTRWKLCAPLRLCLPFRLHQRELLWVLLILALEKDNTR